VTSGNGDVGVRSYWLGAVRTVFSVVALAGAAIVGTAAFAQTSSEIGVAAAVNPQAQGTPPAAEARTLQVGIQVQENERIVTSAGGQAQMLFLDESAFTIGPNSDVVLDEFVFDPSTGTGKIALTAAKGVFRLVGGKISKRTPVTLKTPTATIGIRGGIALVNVAANGATQATFLFGDQMTVDTGGGRRTANRPGFSITATDPDAPPSDPAPTTGEQLNAALGSLEGGGGGDDDGAGGEGESGGQSGGGNQQVPSDEDVAEAGLDDLGSDNDPDALGPVAGGPFNAPGDGGGASSAADDTTSDAQESTREENSGVSIAALDGRYRSNSQYLLNTLNSATGAISIDTARNIGYLLGSAAGGTFTAKLGSSTLSLPVQAGTFSLTNTGTTPFGPVSGTGFLSSDQRFLFYELQEKNHSDNRAFLFGGIPIGSAGNATGFQVKAFTLRKDFLNSRPSDIPFVNSVGASVSTSTGKVSPFYFAQRSSSSDQSSTLQASLAIVGQGSSQQSLFAGHTGTILTNSQSEATIAGGFRSMSRDTASTTLKRGSGAVSSVPDSSGSSLFSNSSGELSYFVLNNDSYSTGQTTLTTTLAFESPLGGSVTSYGFDHVALPTTTPTGIGTTRTSRVMNGYVGGLVERSTTSSFPSFIIENDDSTTGSPGDPTAVRITTNASTNRLDGEFGVQIEDDSRNYDLRFGTTSGSSGRGTFVDDNNFGARDSTTATSNIDSVAVSKLRMFMVNQEVVPTTSFLPSGVSFCSCQFLEWGYWLADARDSSSNTDLFHLATWVAGVLPATVDMPTTGTATYVGHLNGSVDNNGSRYQAAGKFQNAWNFSSQSGTVTVTNFDGENFSSVSVSASNKRDFAGSGSNGTKSISFHGSFFKGGTDASKEQGGQFHIQGTNYKAGGTFAAARQGDIDTTPN